LPYAAQIKEGERNVQLEKEMQLALHPEHGQAESAALKKENERLDLRLSELHATQTRLQTELSNALAKRETSVIKVTFQPPSTQPRNPPERFISCYNIWHAAGILSVSVASESAFR